MRQSTGQPWSVEVGYERFLAPEVFFHPEIYSSDFTTPLPEVVDVAIATSPIDTRRALYKNIVLSGGSTMFKDFGRRIERDIKRVVDARVAQSEEKSGGKHKAQEVEVKARSSPERLLAGAARMRAAQHPCHPRAPEPPAPARHATAGADAPHAAVCRVVRGERVVHAAGLLQGAACIPADRLFLP